jgi:hypothetical protein
MSRVSEFFESLKEGVLTIAPGLETIGSDIGSEMGRLAMQGQSEIASALFTGNGYVPYGQGQTRGDSMDANEGQDAPKIEAPQQDRGGMEM